MVVQGRRLEGILDSRINALMDVLDIGNGWYGRGRVGECDCMRVIISDIVMVRVIVRWRSGRVLKSFLRWRLVSSFLL